MTVIYDPKPGPGAKMEKHVGDFTLEHNTVTTVSKDQEVIVMHGMIRFTHKIINPITGDLTYLAKIKATSGEVTRVMLGGVEWKGAEGNRIVHAKGAVIQNSREFTNYLSSAMAATSLINTPPLQLVSQLGWFGDGAGFYLGGAAIMAPGRSVVEFYFEPVPSSPLRQAGTLAEWKERVGQHIERNPVLMVTSCIAMLSVLLPQFGLGSRLFNLHGMKGTGKTLALQCAASLFGNGIDPAFGATAEDPPVMSKFSTTRNGLEAYFVERSPVPMLLDEATEQDASIIGNLLYSAASGQGKHRMLSNSKAAPQKRWLATMISSSERSVADAVASTGKKLLGGQADRAVDIPIDNLGVVTDFGAFGSFQAITRHLKSATGQYYGTPLVALLEYVVTHPEALKQTLGYLPELETFFLPDGCGHGERRIVKVFAAAFLVGAMMIEAGIFDCDTDALEQAFLAVIEVWWKGRGGALQTVADFLAENWSRVQAGPPSLDSNVAAFWHDGAFVIPAKVFEEAFGREQGGSMLSELLGLGALKREQQNRNKSRHCNNTLFSYDIYADRILPLLPELAEQQKKARTTTARKGRDIEEEAV